MGKSLVIVESPAKAKTINKYLGRNFSVKASIGHVMDLPKKDIGIVLPPDDDRPAKKKTKKRASAKKRPEVKVKPYNPAKIFEPTYVVIPGKDKVVNDLRKAASTADAIYLAADPDREGEAICAHLTEVLTMSKDDLFDGYTPAVNRWGRKGKQTAAETAEAKEIAPPVAVDVPKDMRKKIFRVMFNEITPKSIRAAFDSAGQVDEHLVDAQQARRVLDRIVGYKISPLLWEKVRRGLSAGRVQTVALRLIAERELEIKAFVPKEYWTIHARLQAAEPPIFQAKLWRHKGEEIEISNEVQATAILDELKRATWQVQEVVQKEKRRNAPPPFTTSKLQQASYNRLRYTAKRTMGIAQKLYEGVELGDEGSVALITYMRTDSVRVSNDALEQVRALIPQQYGAEFLPEKPNFYRSKKDAQDAHEAIRPTDAARTPDSVRRYLDDEAFKLYQLIWQRFVASQMVPAVFDQTTIDVMAGDYTFRASGSVEKFAGFLAAYRSGEEDLEKGDDTDEEGKRLPRVSEKETLKLAAVEPASNGGETTPPVRSEQHFTEPPPRYTEATLVKELEEKGIGRPSTYAAIISTIVEREYVTKEMGRFTPTMLGGKVSVLLVKSFEDIFDLGFTARMEEELDEVEEGKLPWKEAVGEFYTRFIKDLAVAREDMESYKKGIATQELCPKCGKGHLLERISRNGFFMGCDRYPDCDYTRDLSPELPTDGDHPIEACPECGKEMVLKRGRFGTFLACSAYPECKTTRRLVQGTRKAHQPDEILEEKCPLCELNLVKKHGRFGEFIGCTGYPKCKYTRPITLGIKCPKCGTGEFVRRGSAGRGGRMRVFYGCSRYPECDFTSPHEPIAEPCPKCGAPFIVEKRTKTGVVRSCIKEGCDWEAIVPEEQPQPELAGVSAKP
ncbi:MAG TPA: type I DNA topoisomerase [Candidatus Acidoferrum sp.]|nr:type I DNA topoisomerase [Candidatus Acidoferrum sp.]